jgi:hypothetical protein
MNIGVQKYIFLLEERKREEEKGRERKAEGDRARERNREERRGKERKRDAERRREITNNMALLYFCEAHLLENLCYEAHNQFTPFWVYSLNIFV